MFASRQYERVCFSENLLPVPNLVRKSPTAKGEGDLIFQRKTEWDLGTRLACARLSTELNNVCACAETGEVWGPGYQIVGT